MNRRGFAGTALAGLAGFLFPQKLFAEIFSAPDYISTYDIFTCMAEQSIYGCSISLNRPVECSKFGKSDLFYYRHLIQIDSSVGGDGFKFEDEDFKGQWFTVDNIDVIFISHEKNKPWRLYDHIGNGRWLIYKDGSKGWV